MRALAKSKTSASSAKKRPSGGLFALKRQRSTNQRAVVVINKINWEGVLIDTHAPVLRVNDKFAFFRKDRIDLFLLPALGYAGGRSEVEQIKGRIEKKMKQNDLDEIAQAVEKRMLAKFATKEEIDTRFKGVEKSLADLTELVKKVAKVVSATDPRP